MNAAEPTIPRSLRAALITWSRRDRRTSGDVTVDTALDLIEAGGSEAREAWSIARTGVVLRFRGTARDVRRAPWQRATPIMLVVVAALTAALVVADAGGWRGITGAGGYGTYVVNDGSFANDVGNFVSPVTDTFMANGAQVSCLLAALLALAAIAGWRWLSVGLAAGMSVALAGWAQAGHLAYTTIVFRQVPIGGDYDGQVETSITMYGVVGLLCVGALLAALAWAITGTLQRRRGIAAPPRRSHRRSIALLGLAVATALVAPRAAKELARGAEDALGVFPIDPLWAEPTQTVWLLVAAIPLIFVAAALAPRRSPAGAVGLVLVGACLWIPAIWLGAGLAMSSPPLAGVVGEGNAALLFYLVASIVGAAAAGAIVARAGRESTPTGGTSNGSPGPASDPLRPAGA